MVPGNGHIFRASNGHNARMLVAERKMRAERDGGLLPNSIAGRIVLVVAVAALMTYVLM